MTELEPDTLLPSPRMQSQASDGEITQIHRGRAYAEVGDTFVVDDATFEVVDVTERTLGT